MPQDPRRRRPNRSSTPNPVGLFMKQFGGTLASLLQQSANQGRADDRLAQSMGDSTLRNLNDPEALEAILSNSNLSPQERRDEAMRAYSRQRGGIVNAEEARRQAAAQAAAEQQAYARNQDYQGTVDKFVTRTPEEQSRMINAGLISGDTGRAIGMEGIQQRGAAPGPLSLPEGTPLAETVNEPVGGHPFFAQHTPAPAEPEPPGYWQRGMQAMSGEGGDASERDAAIQTAVSMGVDETGQPIHPQEYGEMIEYLKQREGQVQERVNTAIRQAQEGRALPDDPRNGLYVDIFQNLNGALDDVSGQIQGFGSTYKTLSDLKAQIDASADPESRARSIGIYDTALINVAFRGVIDENVSVRENDVNQILTGQGLMAYLSTRPARWFGAGDQLTDEGRAALIEIAQTRYQTATQLFDAANQARNAALENFDWRGASEIMSTTMAELTNVISPMGSERYTPIGAAGPPGAQVSAPSIEGPDGSIMILVNGEWVRQ